MPQRSAIISWTPAGRTLIFVLAAASIWCLLAEFYGLCTMRTFFYFVLVPATAVLIVLGVHDRAKGDRQLWNAVLWGAVAGLAGAAAYDIFRLPFVFSRQWGLEGIVPPMPLFKVFPGFGAMLLGEPAVQTYYSPAAHLIGWAYHFSNGASFGIMYAALVGTPQVRHWIWGVMMAVGIELALLASPYTRFFGIPMSSLFVAVTLTAHIIFGAAMGLSARRIWPEPVLAPAQ
jgi:hypothetical protein